MVTEDNTAGRRKADGPALPKCIMRLPIFRKKAGDSPILSGDVVFPKIDLHAKLALLFLGERAICSRNFSIYFRIEQ